MFDEGPFDLVLYRNAAFMYFDAASRVEMLARIRERLVPGGVLVAGNHDRVPLEVLGRPAFKPVSGAPHAFRLASAGRPTPP